MHDLGPAAPAGRNPATTVRAAAPEAQAGPLPAGARAGRRRRIPLSAKLAVALVGLVTVVLVVNGAVNLLLNYDEAKRTAIRVQQEKAHAAAAQVDAFIAEIENQIGWTTRAEWRRIPVEQQRYDFIRLLRQAPAITEVSYIDAAGREQLKVSRLEPDAVGSGRDLSQDARFLRAIGDKVWLGPVTFRRGSEPYMTIAIAHAGRNPGVTAAEVNLKLIWDVIAAIHVGEKGHAFVVTQQGRLIAHPDLTLVLRDTDLSQTPQVRRALDGAAAAPEITRDLGERSVLTAHAPIRRIGWIVFVQSPLAEAMAPVFTSLYQTLGLLGLGLLLASIAGTLLARRMVVPIRRLQEGAERLGGGDLSERIAIRTGDEIETLADRFNLMAVRIQDSYETLEAKVAERTRTLDEALRQQTATAEVLKVISRSAFDLDAVLATLARSAAELCGVPSGLVVLREGDAYRIRAGVGLASDGPVRCDCPESGGIPCGRGALCGEIPAGTALAATVARVAGSGRVEQDEEPAGPDGGGRAWLGVPLLRDGPVEGVFVLAREGPGAFPPRQVELVQTFADQAVIAIENARLFAALQERTRDLSCSLEELRAAQDRLIQSEKLASLGQLTAGIAHEIKNPLNFVNNFAALSAELVDELRQALAGAPLADSVRGEVDELAGLLKGNLAKVVQHGRRADSIVKNMLLHSREGTGERREADLNALVEESLNLAYHGARAEKPGFNVTLERRLDPAAGTALLYPQEMTRVLLNLITNGFYALRQRGSETPGFAPTLVAATRDLGDKVEIRIRDNGTGIPDTVRAKMFTPFFTTKPAGEGTGLGLSLSYDIVVKQHGGTIEVATEPGAFTEFTITLPRAGAAAPPGREPSGRGP
ncbi:multi-sensor signal transduction histidine kinase [Methylobacterium sp. 4-46]|uniref:ATP-binding protein n=1 Tax=unclassified Methylobacterium TaxID=2615210 RepID=UPI000152DB20|nr:MULTISPECIES: ATP-binding protein [Methylobacterium]ACA19618.1 multi-sensor signal transduction histidine kinase [Methylobacterium sp. 4-46]WFT78812.1 cache domain-containing protein [Methylobacterium nodulans]